MRLLFTIFFGLICSSNYSYGYENLYTDGEITVNEDSESSVIQVGKEVVFKIPVYHDDFFGDSVINTNGYITNKTEEKLRASYSISLHDKLGNLIGCYHASTIVEANAESAYYASALIFIEKALIPEITNYKLRVRTQKST